MDLKKIFENYVNNEGTEIEKYILQTICKGIGITVEQAVVLYLLIDNLNNKKSIIIDSQIDLSVLNNSENNSPYTHI